MLVLRLAVSATGEYTQEVGGVANAIANINARVAEINQVYGREYSIRFELIPNNNVLVFADPGTDPWPAVTAGGGCIGGAAVLAAQAMVVDNLIGAANYDISHVFADNSLAGGCGGGYKSGVSVPTIDILRHEMGHQFQQSHTINEVSNARDATWAYELGNAGRSIQGGNSVDFAHAASFHQLILHLAGAGAGIGMNVPTANTIPIVAAGPDRFIPISTPFHLTASAIDPNLADSQTYVWDQLDRGIAQSPPLGNDTEGPLFSRLLPSTSPTRFFPSMARIISNTYTGPLENLPTQPREINLRVTVNDGHEFNYQGGQVPASGVNSDDVNLTVVNNGGPFQVTNPNLVATYTGGSSQNFTWAVGGTNLPPINTSTVKVSLSADGGQTFPIVLAAATANDGFQPLNLPNIDMAQARAKVEAVGNIYFDISDQNFTINQNPLAPGIAVTLTGGSTIVNENGQTDTYSLNLLTAPAGLVTVLISASSQTEVSLDGVTFGPTRLVSFTNTAPQVVTVRGKFDTVLEGPHLGSVSHFVVATNDLASYPAGMPGTPVVVNISDGQLPPVVGVDFDTAGSAVVPNNWVKFSSTLGQSAAGMSLDDGTPTTIGITTAATSCGFGGCSFDVGHNSGSLNSPQHVQDLVALGGVAVSRSGPVTATWNGLKANTKYRVFVFAHYFLGGTTPQTVTITGNGSDNPPPFVQTVGGSLQVNEQTSTKQPLTTFGKEVTSTAGGTIAVAVNAAGETWISGLAIQEVLGTPPPGCQPANLNLTAAQTSSMLFETSGSITSTQAISGTGVVVEYNGGAEVVLNSGFETGLNADFTAGNRGCQNP